MSEIHTNFTIQFNDEVKEAAFNEVIKNIQEHSLAVASNILESEFKGCNFIQGDSISIEQFAKNGELVCGHISSGTLSFDSDIFNTFLLQQGIENAVVDYFFDQVGESENIAVHKGKKVSPNKVMSKIAKIDPTAGLGLAVEKGNSKTVREFLEKGANANGSYKGAPFICSAAFNEQKKVVELLLEFGANPNAKDMSIEYFDDFGQRTALHYACEEGCQSIVKLLLEHDADPNIQDVKGNTPILEPMREDYNKSIIKLLLKYGADINSRNRQGKTPIMVIFENLAGNSTDEDELEYIEWILEQGVDLNAECDNGGNLRWYAGTDKLVSKKLISLGCVDVKAPGNAYESDLPVNLRTAICQGDIKGFESMYSNAVNLSAEILEDCAYYAALCNQVSVLKLLVKDGLNTNISDRERNPLVVAKSVENEEVVNYLSGLHSDSVEKDKKDIDTVKVIYKQFAECMAAFTRDEGDLIKTLSFMNDDCKEQFSNGEKIVVARLQFFGWDYTREYAEISYEHDGQNKITVLRQNLVNGCPEVTFVKSENTWLAASVKKA